MKLFLGHTSALAYWLSGFARRTESLPWRRSLATTHIHPDDIDFPLLERCGLGEPPYHLSVSNASHRPRSTSLKCHLSSGAVPAGSYQPLLPDAWIATPELTFVQTAVGRSMAEVALIGSWLCSAFRTDTLSPVGFEAREPVTDAIRLAAYTNRSTDPGIKIGRSALPYVCENAASPMELAVALLLRLPRTAGGYGLPAASLNHPIPVVTGAGEHRMFYGDLVWPDCRLVVEYDSDLFHLETHRHDSDLRRRNLLIDSGWTVIALSRQQVMDADAFHAVAGQISRSLGLRAPRYVPEGMAEKRRVLRRMLLPHGTGQ